MRQANSGPPTARRILLNAASATYDPGGVGSVTAETATSTTFTWASGGSKSTPYLGLTYFFPLVDRFGRPVLGTATWCVRARIVLLDSWAASNRAILVGVSTSTDLSSGSVPSVWAGFHGTSATGPTARVHIGGNGAASNGAAEAATTMHGTLSGHYARGGTSAGPASTTAASHITSGAATSLTAWGSSQLYLGVNFTTPGAAYSGARSFTIHVDVTQDPA